MILHPFKIEVKPLKSCKMKNSLNKNLERLVHTQEKVNLSISLPTHRTFPDNQQDVVLLKNLVVESEKNLINRYGKREVSGILEKLNLVIEKVNENENLDSLHIFISNEIFEIINLPIPIENSEVIINDSFNVFYLTKAMEQFKEYLVLVLTQNGVKLYDAISNTVVSEIENDDFPFEDNNLYLTHSDKSSDAKQVDNLVREYFNRVDKAIQKIHNETGLRIVVVGTPRNYQHLTHVSDNNNVYLGNSPINYNDVSPHRLGIQSWELIKDN